MVDGFPEVIIVFGACCGRVTIPAVVIGIRQRGIAEQEVIVAYAKRHIFSRVVPGDVDMIPFAIKIDHVPDVIHGVAGRCSPGDAELFKYGAVCHGISLAHARFLFEKLIGGVDGVRQIVFVVGAEIVICAQKLTDHSAGLAGIVNDLVNGSVELGDAVIQIAAGIEIDRLNRRDQIAGVIIVIARYIEQPRRSVQKILIDRVEFIRRHAVLGNVDFDLLIRDAVADIGIEIRGSQAVCRWSMHGEFALDIQIDRGKLTLSVGICGCCKHQAQHHGKEAQ